MKKGYVSFLTVAGVIAAVSPGHAYTVGMECIEAFSSMCPGVSDLPNACDLVAFSNGMGGTVDFVYQNNDVLDGDMTDVTEGGWDDQFADNVDIFVFSGHGTNGGSDNYLGLVIPGSGCVDVSSGTSQQDLYFNREAQLVFLDASCSGSLPERSAVWYGFGGNGGMMIDLKQGFAFMNSPNDTEYRLLKFMVYSDDDMSNRLAWLEAGDGCLFVTLCDEESPIVYTKGNSLSDATSRAAGMKLSNFESYSTPTGNSYKYWYIDNGGC